MAATFPAYAITISRQFHCFIKPRTCRIGRWHEQWPAPWGKTDLPSVESTCFVPICRHPVMISTHRLLEDSTLYSTATVTTSNGRLKTAPGSATVTTSNGRLKTEPCTVSIHVIPAPFRHWPTLNTRWAFAWDFKKKVPLEIRKVTPSIKKSEQSVCHTINSLAECNTRGKHVMILPQVHLRKPCYDFYFL